MLQSLLARLAAPLPPNFSRHLVHNGLGMLLLFHHIEAEYRDLMAMVMRLTPCLSGTEDSVAFLAR